MTPEAFFENFADLADAPNGVQKLRELILQLAVRGKLVPQNPTDEPAVKLLERIRVEKARMVKEKKIRKAEPLLPVSKDDIPFNLPNGWAFCRLGHLCLTVADGPHFSPKYVSGEEGVPFLSTRNVSIKGFDLTTVKYVTRADHEEFCKRTHPVKGDILYTKGGTTGIALVNNLDIEFSIWVHLAVLKIYAPCVFNRYLALTLNSPFCYEQSQKFTHGIGNKDLGLTRMIQITMSLPPFAEQHRIVTKVDHLMALCDEFEARLQKTQQKLLRLNNSALDRLTSVGESEDFTAAWQLVRDNFDLLYTTPETIVKLRQSILQLAVQGRLVPQDSTEEPVAKLLRRIHAEKARLVKEKLIRKSATLPPVTEDESPYDLPQGWDWVRMSAISESRLGKMLDKAKNKGELRPYLRNTNVQWWRFALDDIKSMKLGKMELDEYKLVPGDLLICEGGEPGRCAIWRGQIEEMYFQKALHRVRPMLGVVSEYLQICLRIDASTSRLSKYFTGATIKHFAGQELARYVIPLPPLAEQHRIVAKIDELVAICDGLETRLTKARTKAEIMTASAVQGLVFPREIGSVRLD